MSGKGVCRKSYEEYIEDYLTLRLCMKHQESSVIAARKDLKLFLKYMVIFKARSFTSVTILDYMAWLRNERKNCSGSINRKISSLKMYIRHLTLRRIEGAKEIPAKDLPRARDPYSGPIRVLEFKEILMFLESIEKDTVTGLRNFTLFSIIYAMGLRLSEALGIRLEDIDLKKGLLTIHGKGRKSRLIPITEPVRKLLLDWIIARKCILNAQSEHALFLSKLGKPLSLRMAEHAFKQICSKHKELSVRKVTPHSLRHAFASHAVDGEADMLVLKTIMGHASIKTTEIYIHPSIKTLQKAINNHVASDLLNELRVKRKGVFRMQKRKTA